jgi:septal ring factor EnvC (AmiA/AmiB activator)
MVNAQPVQARTSSIARIGSQPIALTAVALVLLLVAAGSIALWRLSTGASPEPDRVVATRQAQVRAAQASEQLFEKTKALETSQQDSIDQLQVVQDQLQTVKRLLAAQQSDTKRLSDQVGELTGAIDGLRQSFASARSEAASSASAPARRTHSRSRTARGTQRRSARTPG